MSAGFILNCRNTRETVSLHPLTAENWKECAALSVEDSQKNFLPPNVYSIAEAQFYDGARAIYVDRAMVGFVLYGRDRESGSWKIFRLMVDRSGRGRGYGRAAMEAVLSELSGIRGCSEVLVSFQEDNAVARQLYKSPGLRERSREGGKDTVALDLGE